jgi:hypothetical protein
LSLVASQYFLPIVTTDPTIDFSRVTKSYNYNFIEKFNFSLKLLTVEEALTTTVLSIIPA